MNRVHSIDLVRGIVMIIMALDHTRELFHSQSLLNDPLDLATTNPALYLTRWITHLCAPTFVFLSGSSAYLSMKGKNNLASSRMFLIKRGLWLIFLELTVVSFGIFYDFHFRLFIFQVIGAIGFCFIILGLLIGLSPKTIGIIGLLIIFLHNLLPLIPPTPVTGALSVLFGPALYPIGPGRNILVAYPPIPWLGIMLAGFGFARYFLLPDQERKRVLLSIATASIILFFILRFINVYGDPLIWSKQDTVSHTLMSFFNVQKYPPSLLYDLLVLGIMFMLLYAAEYVKYGRLTRAISVYGKVPLFYYLIHWQVLHILMFLMLAIQGFDSKDYVFGFSLGRPKEPSGLPLWGVYLVWICVVLALYPLCRWYNRYKETHRENQLLRYL